MPQDKDPPQLPGNLLKTPDGVTPPDNILDTWSIEPGGSEPVLPPGQDIPELTEVIPPEGTVTAPEAPAGYASAREFLRAQALRHNAPPLKVEAPPQLVLPHAATDDLARQLESVLQAALGQAMAQALETFAADAEAIARRVATQAAQTLAEEFRQAQANAAGQGGNSTENPV